MPLQGYKPSELRARRGFMLVIVGPPNCGKTSLIKTLFDSQHIKKVAFFDMEGGAYVLPDDPRLTIYPVKGWQEMQQVEQDIVAMRYDADTFVFDNFCEIQKMNLDALGLRKLDMQHRITAYNDSTMDMAHYTRSLRNLVLSSGINVVLVCWDDTEKDERANLTKTTIYLTAKLEKYFSGIVDFIGLLNYDEAPGHPYPPVLSFEANRLLPTKLRLPPNDPLEKMPRTIYQPSLGHIIDLWHGLEWPTAKHVAKSYERATVGVKHAN